MFAEGFGVSQTGGKLVGLASDSSVQSMSLLILTSSGKRCLALRFNRRGL